MLHLSSCGCTDGELTRVPRRIWMRAFFPSRRLFECGNCHRRALLRPGKTGSKTEPVATMFALGALCAFAGLALTLWSWSSRSAVGVAPAATEHAAWPLAHRPCNRVHIYTAGETFESIAEQELGDSTKWQEIRIANREWLDVSANGLEPGARLLVPIPCPN